MQFWNQKKKGPVRLFGQPKKQLAPGLFGPAKPDNRFAALYRLYRQGRVQEVLDLWFGREPKKEPTPSVAAGRVMPPPAATTKPRRRPRRQASRPPYESSVIGSLGPRGKEALAEAAAVAKGLGGSHESERFIWLLDLASAAELAAALPPGPLKDRLKKFAKATDGGWLLGDKLSRLDEALLAEGTVLNGLVLTPAELATLPGNHPGRIVPCDN